MSNQFDHDPLTDQSRRPLQARQRDVTLRIENATDPEEVKRLGDQMGLMVFKDLMRKNAGKLSFAGCDEL